MDLGVANGVYLTAASTSGLGRAVATALARDGATVWIGSRKDESVHETVAEMESTGWSAGGSVLDVTDPRSISDWVAAALGTYGRIDGLLVNAGGPPPGTFESFTDHDWQMGFELTLLSTVRLIREVLPTMKRQRSGSILVITSSSILEPIDRLILSGVMRSGVANLVKTLSREMGAHGIRINNIVPGRIDTPRVQYLEKSTAKERGITTDEVRAEHDNKVPLGRCGTIDEFGNVGAFLLSPAGSYVTGEMVVVDGGVRRGVW